MIPGHPHTVRSSPVPLYLKGFPPPGHHLGQDMEPSSYDFGSDLISPGTDSISSMLPGIPAVTPMDTTSFAPGGTLIAPTSAPLSLTSAQTAALNMQPGLSPSQLTQLYQSAAAAGTMTPAQAASAIAQLSTGAAAVAAAAAGPAPRVALPAVATTANPLTAATIIPGVPNYLLLGIAAIAAVAMGSK